MKFTIFVIAAFFALSASGQSCSESEVDKSEAEEVGSNTIKPDATTNATTATDRGGCGRRDTNTEVLLWACDDTMTAPILKSYSAAGSLMTQQLQSLFAAHCALTGNKIWPADATDAVLEDNKFDFIVVGAGSAGSVVASRLSENASWRVLLVEAGGNPTVATETPQTFYNNINTAEDWAYKTEPQEGACRGYKAKGCAVPRGKVLGGCSSINALFYVRGNKKNFDDWAANGCEGWSYEDVLPYFIKSENYSQYTTENSKYHGSNGYLSVENNPNLSELENLVIKGAIELGLEKRTDINGDNQMGITKSCTTTRNGIRCSTARGYLSPVKDRKNLHVLKYAYATNLVFEPGTNVIKGVSLLHNGEEIFVEATKEVIVSDGGGVPGPFLKRVTSAVLTSLLSLTWYSSIGGSMSLVAQAFEASKIVPDVIPTPPTANIELKYPSGVYASQGNELTPTQVKDQPSVSYKADENAYYTLIFQDPDNYDGPEPVYREWHHWLVGNIPGGNVSEGEVLSGYIGSGPPEGTGIHRYIYLLYKQPGKLEFDETRLTNKSIDGRAGFSTKKFAEKYNLGAPIAGNFYRAQFDDYVPKLYKSLGV